METTTTSRGRPPIYNNEDERRIARNEASRKFRETKKIEDPDYYRKYSKRCPICCSFITKEDNTLKTCNQCGKPIDNNDVITWNILNDTDPDNKYTTYYEKVDAILLGKFPNKSTKRKKDLYNCYVNFKVNEN